MERWLDPLPVVDRPFFKIMRTESEPRIKYLYLDSDSVQEDDMKAVMQYHTDHLRLVPNEYRCDYFFKPKGNILATKWSESFHVPRSRKEAVAEFRAKRLGGSQRHSVISQCATVCTEN